MPAINPSFRSVFGRIAVVKLSTITAPTAHNYCVRYNISKNCVANEIYDLLDIEDELLRLMKAAELQVKYGRYEA
jgi:hypothetical protein